MIPEKGFFFDEAKHRYYLDSKQLTGVTTILGVIAKPALIGWAANMAVDYVKTHSYPLDKGLFSYEPIVLEEARTAHAQKRDKSAEIGTQAHSWISSWINAQINATEQIEANPALSLMTDNFLKWIEEAKPKFLASEKIVYSVDKFYAGTLDFLAEIDGKVYLGDIKTGSGIYQDMWLQTAGYQLALEETEPNLKIDGHIIVNITKNGKLNVETHYDYETSKQGFLAALTLYRVLNNKL